jgi:cytochrome c-type biogenesis protein CcmE
LQATQILAKHDENYTPPEVAEAMNEAHARKQEQLEAKGLNEENGGNKYYMDSKQ